MHVADVRTERSGCIVCMCVSYHTTRMIGKKDLSHLDVRAFVIHTVSIVVRLVLPCRCCVLISRVCKSRELKHNIRSSDRVTLPLLLSTRHSFSSGQMTEVQQLPAWNFINISKSGE